MSDVRICVDAMGGDEPAEVVLAGIEAALEADRSLTVLVAGPEDVVVPFCDSHERAESLVAPDVITMEDDPINAVMTKRKSSIVLGCRAVKKGAADGFFSAGSTGAITAAGTAYVTPFKAERDGKKTSSIVLGCRAVKKGAADGFFSAGSTGAITAAGTAYVTPFKAERDGKKTAIRPCLTNALPNRRGGLTVMCDMGANPDVEPWDMVRFAHMGAAYASCVLGVDEPSVGLLSNGTEEHKGSAFTQSCYPLMAEYVPGFAGNCEGGDITSGSVDVVVCNGFDGNIALKSIEGAAKFMMGELKAGMTANLKGKVAALLMRNMLRALKHKLSGDAKGGAILLGLRGVVMIGHGATRSQGKGRGLAHEEHAARSQAQALRRCQGRGDPARSARRGHDRPWRNECRGGKERHACLRGGGARTPCRTRPGVHGARGVASLHPTYLPRLFACSRAGVFIPCACGGACFVEMRTLRRFPCARAEGVAWGRMSTTQAQALRRCQGRGDPARSARRGHDRPWRNERRGGKERHACLRGGGARTPCRTRPGVHGARGVASLHPTYLPRLFACSRAGVFHTLRLWRRMLR